MSTIRPLWLLMILLVSGVLGWAGALLTAGAGLPAPVLVTTSVITLAAVAVLVLILGIRVQRDKRQPAAGRMNPVAAARTLVLAQAGAYAGMLIAGWHVGVVVELASATGFGTPTVNDALVMIIAGLVLVIVGFIVERFCRLPPEDDGNGAGGRNGSHTAGPEHRRGPAYGPEGEGGYATHRDGLRC